MAKYRVTLTTDERNALEKLVSVGKAAARKLTHGRILLLADTADGREHADDQIVLALGTSLRSVERIRTRFVTEGLAAALTPKPPPARTKSKSRGTLRSTESASRVALPLKAATIGPYNCWPTHWWCGAWSLRAVPRPSDRQ
jgi:hypothetical protein